MGTRVAFLVDSSGSMAMDELRMSYAELKAILATGKATIYMIMADAGIAWEGEVKKELELPTHMMGGGGTDFRPAMKRAGEVDADLIVYFTDGYGTYPEEQPTQDVLWLVTPGGSIGAECGRQIQIKKQG